MIKLRDNLFAPAGGWRYEQPETGEVLSKLDKKSLIIAVRNHRIAKGILVGNVEADIDAYLCAKLKPGACVHEEENHVVQKKSFTVADVISFGESVAHTLKAGGVVSQGEANRRASICLSCPKNMTVEGCTGCSGVATFIYEILGAKQTSYQKRLKQCGVCGCSLAAKVWITKEELEHNQHVSGFLDKYPSNCWMKQPPQG